MKSTYREPLRKHRKTIKLNGHEIRYIKRNRQYIQFDNPYSMKRATEFFEDVEQNPQKILSHQFLPVILNELTYEKLYVVKEDGSKKLRTKTKIRPIVEVGHGDALLYSLYATKLSELYELKVESLEIENIATAYRKERGSNIQASKEIMDRIASESCWIFKGDFVGFFDNLNHKVLKERVASLVKEDSVLPDDWYVIIRAIMNFREIKHQNIPDSMEKYAKSSGRYVRTIKDLDAAIKNKQLVVSQKHQSGIPQGTSISAVLANVYMLEFDNVIHDLISNYGGVYRRYSDDFVVILPIRLSLTEVLKIVDKIKDLTHSVAKLKLEDKKTKIFRFDKSQMIVKKLKRNEESTSYSFHNSVFDYLGFIFDGQRISLRSKGLFKYTYKARSSIRLMANRQAHLKRGKVWVLNDYKRSSMITNRYYLDLKENVRSYRGYAATAEKVFESSQGDYKVIIDKQVRKVIAKYQRYLHERKSLYS